MDHHRVRGHQAYSRPASTALKCLSRASDGVLAAALVFGGIFASGASSVPRLTWAAAWLAALAGIAGFSRAFMGRTPGEAIWQLAPPPGQSKFDWVGRIWSPELKQLERQTAENLVTAISLTAFAVLGLYYCAQRALFTNPVWAVSPAVQFDPFVPGLGDETNQWTVAPFFYALGAWPTRIHENSVFHVIPYEKGPPQRFPGKVIARWDPPQIKLTLEGPKTPPGTLPREQVMNCFRPVSFPSVKCLKVREAVLSRHLQEIKSTLTSTKRTSWQVEWFTVRNSALPARELPQGLHLHAHAAELAQDRYILITPQGTHQSLILDYQRDEPGLDALHLLEKSVRSVRISDDLGPGRAWIDTRIEQVRLSDLDSFRKNPEKLVANLSEIQLLLLSKLSVDPATFETYFHLGGLGLTLLRHAVKSVGSAKSDDWKAIARPTIEAAVRFAEDVKPSDPRIGQLRDFAIEAQKF